MIEPDNIKAGDVVYFRNGGKSLVRYFDIIRVEPEEVKSEDGSEDKIERV